MNFSLKNYSCELFNLTGKVGKVELISTLTTVICESWNASEKYSWDNAGDLSIYPGTRLSARIIGAIKGQFFHMVTHVFDNSNLSREILAIDTCRAVICSLGHGRKHMFIILPIIWGQGLRLLFVLATEHTFMRIFLNIWHQIWLPADLQTMLLFRISVQLSMEHLIAHAVCNFQHASAI